MADERAQILLVIPCYKESERLPAFLAELCSAIESSGLPVRVRPVDDGSGEAEAAAMTALVKELQPEHSCLGRAVLLEKNRGKGGAVYAGWDSAEEERFDWLAFVDADGAVSAEETLRVLTDVSQRDAESGECVFAVRVGGDHTPVQRTPIRKLLGNMFRIMVRVLYRLPCRDTQCGMKVIPRARFREVREQLKEERFVFDVELAARLVRSGCSIIEIPIAWQESPGTRLRMSSAARMLSALFAVRWRLFGGK